MQQVTVVPSAVRNFSMKANKWKFSSNKSQQEALFLNFILVKSTLPQIKLGNIASCLALIIRIYHDARSSECQKGGHFLSEIMFF